MYHLSWGSGVAETIEIGIRFLVERRGKSPLDATFRTARASFAWYVDYSKVKAGELTTEQAIRGGLRHRRGLLSANGPTPRNASQAPREVRVSLRETEAQTSNARGSYPRNGCCLGGRERGNRSQRTPRRRNLDSHKMGAGRPGDGDESEIEPDEDPRRSLQRIYTYLSRVGNKSQTL